MHDINSKTPAVNNYADPGPILESLDRTLGCTVQPSDPIKVGDHQPSLARRGQAALDRLEQDRHFDNWVDVTLGLAELHADAMVEAETNKPQGPRYRAAIASRHHLYGYDRLHKSTRSFLLKKFAPNLDAIVAWRKAQPPEMQLKLNDPKTVLSAWNRALKPKLQPTKTKPAVEIAETGTKTTETEDKPESVVDHRAAMCAIWDVAVGDARSGHIKDVLRDTPVPTLLKAMSEEQHDWLFSRVVSDLAARISNKKEKELLQKLRKRIDHKRLTLPLTDFDTKPDTTG
jgi:hypothetical protein